LSYMRRQKLRSETSKVSETTLLAGEMCMDNFVHLSSQWFHFVTCNDERCRYEHEVLDYKLPIDCEAERNPSNKENGWVEPNSCKGPNEMNSKQNQHTAKRSLHDDADTDGHLPHSKKQHKDTERHEVIGFLNQCRYRTAAEYFESAKPKKY